MVETLSQNDQLESIGDSSKQIENLEDILKKSNSVTNEMQNLISELDRKHPKVMGTLKNLIMKVGVAFTGGSKQGILDEVKKVNLQLADQTLVIGDQASAELAVNQMNLLTQTWNEIRNAGKIENESKEIIEKIETKIAKMETLGKEILDLIAAYNGGKFESEPEKKAKILTRIRALYTQLRTGYIEIRKEISTLKVRIGNELVNLKFIDIQQNIALVQNLILGAVSLVKAFKSSDSGSMQYLHTADCGGHFSRALLNAEAKFEVYKAKQKLEALRETIDGLEQRLAEIKLIKAQVKEFLVENGFSKLSLKN